MRWLLICLFQVLLPALATAQAGEDYQIQGLDKMKKHDLDGALTAFTYAISLSPDNPSYHFYRAQTELRMDLFDESITDCNASFETPSTHSNPFAIFAIRCAVKIDKNDLKGAQADFDRARELSSSSQQPSVYNLLAHLQAVQGEWPQALDTINYAIKLNPADGHFYGNRAFIKQASGDLAGAVTDYRRSCTLEPDYCDFVHWSIWVIWATQGQTAAADEQLSSWMLRGKSAYPQDWRIKVGRFLLGKISETDLLASAASPNCYRAQGQYCEAYYYAGMKHLLSGDKSTAIADFRQSVATKRMAWTEYICAQAELRALGQTP